MPWAKIEGAIYDNPKVERAGLVPRALYLISIAYCAKALTDGLVPDDMIPRLAAKADVPAAQLDDAIRKLVTLRLWDRDDPEGGYQVHDYLDYNPNRADYEDFVATRTANGKKGGRPRKVPRPVVLADSRPENLGGLHGGLHGGQHHESTVPSTVESTVKTRDPYSVTRDPVIRDHPPLTPHGGNGQGRAPRPDVLDPPPPPLPPVSAVAATRTPSAPQPPPPPRTAKDDRWRGIWAALCEGIGSNPSTKTEQTNHARSVDEIYAIHPSVDGDRVRRVCANYRVSWAGKSCTARAVVTHWSRFDGPPQAAPAAPANSRLPYDGKAAREASLRLLRGGDAAPVIEDYTEARFTVRGD